MTKIMILFFGLAISNSAFAGSIICKGHLGTSDKVEIQTQNPNEDITADLLKSGLIVAGKLTSVSVKAMLNGNAFMNDHAQVDGQISSTNYSAASSFVVKKEFGIDFRFIITNYLANGTSAKVASAILPNGKSVTLNCVLINNGGL